MRLRAEGEWSADADASLTYSVVESFPASAWDWIGLYAVSGMVWGGSCWGVDLFLAYSYHGVSATAPRSAAARQNC